MCLTTNGCCGKKLRPIGMILGWLSLVLFTLAIIVKINRIIKFESLEMPEYSDNLKQQTLQKEFIKLAVYSIDVLISGLLIIGIQKNKHCLILPWLVLRAIELLIAIPVVLLVLALSSYLGKPDRIIKASIQSIILGLLVWSWIIIYSLYKEIRNNVNKPLPMSTEIAYYESQGRSLGPTQPYEVLE